MRRREFIAGIGSAAAWPLAAGAQQGGRVRRVGVLMFWSDNPEARAYFTSFVGGLAHFGWLDGDNVRIEQRWANANVDRARALAKELVAWQPDVIFATTTPMTAALQRETDTIPVVFALVVDPVAAGFVAALSRPASNMTGFINFESTIGGKLFGLLNELTRGIKRAAIIFNPDTAPGGGTIIQGSFEAAARSLAVEPIILHVHSDAEIETAVASLGGNEVGLVVGADAFMLEHYQTIIAAATSNKVPTITEWPVFARMGGLMSYGPSYTDIIRRAAGHVDRILRGAKPADLPVEVPTRYDLVINLMTAKALGLDVPPTLLAVASEVIE